MNIKEILRNLGEKTAIKSVDLRSFPLEHYQPKPPIKIQALINKN